MKKAVAALLIALVAVSLCACTKTVPNGPSAPSDNRKVEISFWTYTIGGWGNESTVADKIAAFHREYHDIKVTPKIIDYADGDRLVEEAIAANKAPDIIMEGPERLVANWGARGLMVKLNDLWQSPTAEEIYDSVRPACRDANDDYFIYPMCMTTHCMAINKDMFVKAGAWDLIDEETHTWSTENFFKAVEKLNTYCQNDIESGEMDGVAAVYCLDQGGDQGTRALVNNLYSGTFTDPTHTQYTVNSEKNIRALSALKNTPGIIFDPTIAGGDEVEKFCNQKLAMAFCWNVFMEIKAAKDYPDCSFDIFPMTFPTDDGKVNLQGGIWGMGIFDNGDAAKIDAAKKFIRFMLDDDAHYSTAVIASAYWPVRDIPDPYVNNRLMTEYAIFHDYFGDYYQVAPNWADTRAKWWKMLREVGAASNDDAIQAAVDRYFPKSA